MKYTIGEVSKLFGIPVTTIRHYDNKGIFKANYVDSETGYRYYSSSQFELLNSILNLRYSEVPLEKIKKYTEDGNFELLKKIFEEQQKNIREKINELEKIEKNIAERLKYLKKVEKIDELGVIKIKNKKPNDCFVINQPFESEVELELLVRELGSETNFENDLTLGNVGLLMEKNSDYNCYDGVFLNKKTSNQLITKDSKGYNLTQKEGEYITIYFEGTRKDSPKYYKKIDSYIIENDIQTENIYYEIALTEKKSQNNEKTYIRMIEIRKI